MTRRTAWKDALILLVGVLVVSTAEPALSATRTAPNPISAQTTTSVAGSTTKLKSAVAVTSGYLHTCALTGGGAALCWGYNGYGELGDNSLTSSTTPVPVYGRGSGVQAITAGYFHTCLLTGKGAAKCWGYNGYGQLGDNTTTNSPKPVQVYGLTKNVKAISGGYFHTCALSEAGVVRCWGYNLYGQLGDGTTTNSAKPVKVLGLGKGVQAISAGLYHTCAIIRSGAVKCWGFNADGQLGDGTTTNQLTAVPVVKLGIDVKTVKAGYLTTCAVNRKAAAKCWGFNGDGQLGDNTTTDSAVPVTVYGLDSNVKTVRVAVSHACAIKKSGVTKCWGSNAYGELGDNSTTNSLRPVAVYNLADATGISLGYLHSCVLTATRAIKCWGYNEYGQLGNGTTVNSPKPQRVQGF